jgi:hypothetical protein
VDFRLWIVDGGGRSSGFKNRESTIQNLESSPAGGPEKTGPGTAKTGDHLTFRKPLIIFQTM